MTGAEIEALRTKVEELQDQSRVQAAKDRTLLINLCLQLLDVMQQSSAGALREQLQTVQGNLKEAYHHIHELDQQLRRAKGESLADPRDVYVKARAFVQQVEGGEFDNRLISELRVLLDLSPSNSLSSAYKTLKEACDV